MQKVLKALRLIDGTGRPPLSKAAVVVERNRIVRVSTWKEVQPRPDDLVIALDTMTLLPGLTDAHVHIFGERPEVRRPFRVSSEAYRAIRSVAEARALLHAGFTSVRDLGSMTAPALRQAIEEGLVAGPRMLAATAWITQTAGTWEASPHVLVPACTVDGVDQCIQAVRQSVRDGATVLKIGTSGPGWGDKPMLTLEEIRALVTEAHRMGLQVAAHAIGPEGVRNALEGGVDTIEHGYGVTEELYSRMAERGVILVPTLAPSYWQGELGAQRGVLPERQERAKRTLAIQMVSVQLARRHGVTIATGTDAIGAPVMPLGENAVELQLLVEAGLRPMEAIVASTRVGAKVMSMERDLGTVTPGMLADLIAVPGDPLKEIRLLQDVRFVMKGGEVVLNRVGGHPSLGSPIA